MMVPTMAGAGGGTSGATMSGAGKGGSAASSASERMGGSAIALAGAAGMMSMLPGDGMPEAAPGETGIFVGATAAHNAARAAEMLDPPLPDMTWDSDLAALAQDWANTLAKNCGTIMHRMPNQYGENIAERGSTRLTTQYSAAEAVADWVSEKACWSYGTINGSEVCDQACATNLHSNGCGHYTQVVWRNSTKVGCGYAQCQDGQFTDELWVCNYDPHGNIIGQAPY
jgi:hypothetical protein